MKKTFPIAALAATLSACVSAPQLTAPPQNTQNAQDALAKALSAQLHTSFGYRSDIYVSNAIRESQLANATPEQRNASRDIKTVCEHNHDRDYIAAAKQLHQEGVALEDLAKSAELATRTTDIRREYQHCVAQREQAVKEAQAKDAFDFDAFFAATEGMDELARLELFYEQYQANEASSDGDDSDAWANYLPDYDTSRTAEDAKQAQLIKDYLIKPTSISMTGRYQPMAGQLTMLPQWSYDTKNLNAYLNQPIHIDLKKGVIYLWADNFALLTGFAIDKTLGDQWQSKWLAIPINDGTLPENFAKDLMKFILQAKKDSFNSLEAQGFGWVDSDEVLSLAHLQENLPPQAQQTIKSTNRIIKQTSSDEARAYARYVFADSLFNAIVKAYPEFAPELSNVEREIREGESIIEVVNLPNENAGEAPIQAKSRLNSRVLINGLLLSLSIISDRYQASLAEPKTPSPYAPLSHYGLQNNGKGLSWVHQRYYLGGNAQHSLPKTLPAPLLIDSFTSISAHKPTFDRLPADAREPNAQNTVNVYEYTEQLMQNQDALSPLMGSVIGRLLGMDDGETDGYEIDDGQQMDGEDPQPSLQPPDAPQEPQKSP